jgi:hypothetical protein
MPYPIYAESIALAPGQYEESTYFRDLLRVLIGALHTQITLEEIEDVLQAYKTELVLPTAVGGQLDILGVILGCPRVGMTDAEYRFRLYIQIGINTSNGLPGQLITLADLVWSPDWVQLLEAYPGNTARCFFLCVRLAAGGTAPPAEITDWIQKWAPAGVQAWFTSALDNTPFGFFDDTLSDGFDEIDAIGVRENIGGCWVELWPHASGV